MNRKDWKGKTKFSQNLHLTFWGFFSVLLNHSREVYSHNYQTLRIDTWFPAGRQHVSVLTVCFKLFLLFLFYSCACFAWMFVCEMWNPGRSETGIWSPESGVTVGCHVVARHWIRKSATSLSSEISLQTWSVCYYEGMIHFSWINHKNI